MKPRPRARNARLPRPHSARKLCEFPAVTKVAQRLVEQRLQSHNRNLCVTSWPPHHKDSMASHPGEFHDWEFI
eukprot:1331918-Pyramimonas_sp.AAC.1